MGRVCYGSLTNSFACDKGLPLGQEMSSVGVRWGIETGMEGERDGNHSKCDRVGSKSRLTCPQWGIAVLLLLYVEANGPCRTAFLQLQYRDGEFQPQQQEHYGKPNWTEYTHHDCQTLSGY